MSDIVLELESFPSSPDATAASAFYAREYHGIFRVRKYPRLNSLLAAGGRRLGGRDGDVVGGAGQDLAFKCRRRRFCIETLHLPPDLADGKGDEKEGKHDQKRTTSAKQRASNAHDKNVGVTGGHAAAAVDW